MKKIIESKAFEKMLEGSDEQKLHKFDQILAESKIKRIATFDKYVIGIDEGKEDKTAIVRVSISEGKIVKIEDMKIELREEAEGPSATRALVEWCIGGPLPDEDQFAEFLNKLSTKEAQMSVTERKLSKFLANMPAPKEEWVKTFGDDAKKLAEETFQSIGSVLDHLSAISVVAEKVANTQALGKVCESAAPFAQPLGSLVSDMRSVLGQGDALGAQKFLEQFNSRWYDLVVTGKFLKNAGEVK